MWDTLSSARGPHIRSLLYLNIRPMTVYRTVFRIISLEFYLVGRIPLWTTVHRWGRWDDETSEKMERQEETARDTCRGTGNNTRYMFPRVHRKRETRACEQTRRGETCRHDSWTRTERERRGTLASWASRRRRFSRRLPRQWRCRRRRILERPRFMGV